MIHNAEIVYLTGGVVLVSIPLVIKVKKKMNAAKVPQTLNFTDGDTLMEMRAPVSIKDPKNLDVQFINNLAFQSVPSDKIEGVITRTAELARLFFKTTIQKQLDKNSVGKFVAIDLSSEGKFFAIGSNDLKAVENLQKKGCKGKIYVMPITIEQLT